MLTKFYLGQNSDHKILTQEFSFSVTTAEILHQKLLCAQLDTILIKKKKIQFQFQNWNFFPIFFFSKTLFIIWQKKAVKL